MAGVAGEGEDVEVARVGGGDAAVFVVEGLGKQQGHHLLVAPAVGAESAPEHTEVVVLRGLADDDVAPGEHADVADAVGCKLKLEGGHFAVVDFRDAFPAVEEADDLTRPSGVVKVDHDQRAKGAVVDDVGVGDGADDGDACGTEPFVEQGLDVDDLRVALFIVLGVHAVVGGGGDDAPCVEQAPDLGVDLAVEVQRLLLVGCELVLHVVGEREVEEVGPALLDECGTGLEDVDGGVAGVDLGAWPADDVLGVVDAVGVLPRLVDLLGGEDDAAALDDAVAKYGAELFLGGDEGDLAPCVRGGVEQGVAAAELGRVHHDLLAGVGVEEEVAADAGDRRGGTGDDGGVVDVGEAGQGAAYHAAVSLFEHGLEAGHVAPCDGFGDVFVGASVNADHGDGAVGGAVAAAVRCKGGHGLVWW